jgi:hypothetical protein
VLLAQGRDRALLSLDAEPLRPVPLTGPGLVVAQSPAPLLATSGDSVALADFARSIVVSPDRGQTFRRVAGTANTTALAGAHLAGATRFFAALYRETTDQSEILLLDPVSGEASCIARLDGSSEPSASSADPVDRGEWAKVARLIWHAPSERLWAVGGFGVLTFAAPDAA